MDGTIWLLLVIMAILMWAATSLLYKAGAHTSAGGAVSNTSA